MGAGGGNPRDEPKQSGTSGAQVAHKRRISKPHFVMDGPIQLPSHTPKSERRFAKLCDAIFAHALGSKSVVLLVLESKFLKSGLLVLVACFGIQG